MAFTWDCCGTHTDDDKVAKAEGLTITTTGKSNLLQPFSLPSSAIKISACFSKDTQATEKGLTLLQSLPCRGQDQRGNSLWRAAGPAGTLFARILVQDRGALREKGSGVRAAPLPHTSTRRSPARTQGALPLVHAAARGGSL